MAHSAVKGQFAYHQGAFQAIGPELLGSSQDANGDRQIVGRTFFAQVGRGEIDRHPPAGTGISGRSQSGSHPIARLPDRRVRQTDDRERRFRWAYVDFDPDRLRFDADQSDGGD